MKFKPGWRFWLNVVLCLFNLGVFVLSKSMLTFGVSIVCCVCAMIAWKLDRALFDFTQEQLKNSFDKKENKDV